MSASLDGLPLEILTNIGRYLSEPKDVFMLASTCNAIRDAFDRRNNYFWFQATGLALPPDPIAEREKKDDDNVVDARIEYTKEGRPIKGSIAIWYVSAKEVEEEEEDEDVSSIANNSGSTVGGGWSPMSKYKAKRPSKFLQYNPRTNYKKELLNIISGKSGTKRCQICTAPRCPMEVELGTGSKIRVCPGCLEKNIIRLVPHHAEYLGVNVRLNLVNCSVERKFGSNWYWLPLLKQAACREHDMMFDEILRLPEFAEEELIRKEYREDLLVEVLDYMFQRVLPLDSFRKQLVKDVFGTEWLKKHLSSEWEKQRKWKDHPAYNSPMQYSAGWFKPEVTENNVIKYARGAMRHLDPKEPFAYSYTNQGKHNVAKSILRWLFPETLPKGITTTTFLHDKIWAYASKHRLAFPHFHKKGLLCKKCYTSGSKEKPYMTPYFFAFHMYDRHQSHFFKEWFAFIPWYGPSSLWLRRVPRQDVENAPPDKIVYGPKCVWNKTSGHLKVVKTDKFPCF